jgi:hypothetical protein
LEFKYLFYSSVAGAAASVSAAEQLLLLFSALEPLLQLLELLLSVAAGAFSVASASLSNLYQKVLQQLQLLLKIKFYRLI